MDFSKLNLLAGLSQRMQFLSARSSVIAQNIANADTPGYRTKDLSEKNFNNLVRQNTVMRTSKPGHISATGRSFITTTTSNVDDGTASLDENSVSIETETMKLAQTRMQYGLASTVYRKGLDMLRIAIRSDR